MRIIRETLLRTQVASADVRQVKFATSSGEFAEFKLELFLALPAVFDICRVTSRP